VTQACVIAASEVLMAASSIFKTKRQEAKAAADAAAAAAADACAVCEKLYGDDPEKDDLWIACDRCNRWYHGACVDLTQVIHHQCTTTYRLPAVRFSKPSHVTYLPLREVQRSLGACVYSPVAWVYLSGGMCLLSSGVGLLFSCMGGSMEGRQTLQVSSGMGLLFSCMGGSLEGRQTLQDSVPENVVYVRCAEAVYSINAYHPSESAQGTS